MESIEEKNIAMAEFEGLVRRENVMLNLDDGHSWIAIADLDYHTNWNSLMRVVEKIEELDTISVEIQSCFCAVRDSMDNIILQTHKCTLSKIIAVHDLTYQFTQFIKTQQQ